MKIIVDNQTKHLIFKIIIVTLLVLGILYVISFYIDYDKPKEKKKVETHYTNLEDLNADI